MTNKQRRSRTGARGVQRADRLEESDQPRGLVPRPGFDCHGHPTMLSCTGEDIGLVGSGLGQRSCFLRPDDAAKIYGDDPSVEHLDFSITEGKPDSLTA